jgi:hypothetical protein
MISFFLILASVVAFDQVETLESSTYCIELCTKICIDKPDVYPCFDDCTMIECSKRNSDPESVKNSSFDRIGMGILVIVVGATLKVIGIWCRKLRRNSIFLTSADD